MDQEFIWGRKAWSPLISTNFLLFYGNKFWNKISKNENIKGKYSVDVGTKLT
jgi:hypothetical protein